MRQTIRHKKQLRKMIPNWSDEQIEMEDRRALPPSRWQRFKAFLSYLKSRFDGSSKWLLFILALMWVFSLMQSHWIEMAITTVVVGAWYVLGSWMQYRKR